MRVNAIFISIVVFLLLLFVFFHLFFNGNPISRTEINETVKDYLKSNYPEQSFRINNIGYYPGEGTYIVNVVSKDGTIHGNIDVRKGKIIHDEIELPADE
jgi:hypothetical protein